MMIDPATLEKAQAVANRLPYVRVVPGPANGNPAKAMERNDVFVRGIMSPRHNSEECRRKEERLGLRPILYFHAGRTHEAYGDAVFVFDTVEAEHTATPFGLGALCCLKAAPPQGRCTCLYPVSHDSHERQGAFVRRWTWLLPEWRERAAQYLVENFGDDFRRYFALGDAGRPRTRGPEGVYDNEVDFRAWTIEIQALDDLDIRTHARHLRHWGYAFKREKDDAHRLMAPNAKPEDAHSALLDDLPWDLQVAPPGGEFAARTLLAHIDDLVKMEVCGDEVG